MMFLPKTVMRKLKNSALPWNFIKDKPAKQALSTSLEENKNNIEHNNIKK